jgi:hypothetical protein
LLNPTPAASASSPAPNLQEMALLYRQVAADLSVLRQDATARTYAVHVNQLLARAHHIIYSGRKTNLRTLFLFLRDEYPAVFQRQLGLRPRLHRRLRRLRHSRRRPHHRPPGVHAPLRRPDMIATMERHQMWTESIVSVAPAKPATS